MDKQDDWEQSKIEGLYVNPPNGKVDSDTGEWVQSAPEFVVCRLSFHKKQFQKWLEAKIEATDNKKGDYINCQVLIAKTPEPDGSPKYYAKVDNWEPNVVVKEEIAKMKQEIEEDDIPF